MNRWISVDDSLPLNDGELTWVCIDGEFVESDVWNGDRGEVCECANGSSAERIFISSGWESCKGSNITHWMPIDKPNPPSSSDEEVLGEWIYRYDENADIFFRKRYYCSCCGSWQTYGKTKFCMDCGHPMKTDKEET